VIGWTESIRRQEKPPQFRGRSNEKVLTHRRLTLTSAIDQ